MSDLPAAQRHALEAWADDAIAAGWLAMRDKHKLESAETASPAQLFQTSDRPLVVGFFGGTGVGKSTLLNRFADEAVARTSVERPTSRAITVYVHRSVSVDRLPESFPMRKMRTALHNNDQYRHVLFVDMPDFDSVESANRDLVDSWLPHLDVVLYVVSPDRYRDDQGWRLLLKHASQHAWMFIMNHWDRGEPEQLEDFRSQLAAAGLQNPLLYRTDCSGADAVEDDFNDLQSVLQKTADQSIIQSLSELGVVARLKAQKRISDNWLSTLGTPENLQLLAERWSSSWQEASSELVQSLQGKMLLQAAQFAQQNVSWLQKLRSGSAHKQAIANPQTTLVDDALLTRLDNQMADFLNQQSQSLQLPLAALKEAIAEPYARARRDIANTVDDALNLSLAAPGNRAQRALHKSFGVLCVCLPLAAMGWIAWRVINGFSEGGSNPAAYLGSNFAVNGSLLLGLSWLIPFFLERKTRPSTEKAAFRGLSQGLNSALAEVERSVGSGLSMLKQEAETLATRYHTLWQTLAAPDTSSLPGPVKRMLAEEISQPVQRTLDVRANTQSSTDSAPAS